MKDVIFICNRCRISRKQKERDDRRGGDYLHEAVSLCINRLKIPILVKSVECLSACDRYCAVAFQGRDKVTWVFGDLPAEEDDLGESVTAIKEFAQRYLASKDGFFERKERPFLLQGGILARIPPLNAFKKSSWKISGPVDEGHGP